MPHCSLKDWITLADLEDIQFRVEERPSLESSQQLKSHPKIRKCEDISGRAENKVLKNASSSQFGPYTVY